MQEHRPDLLEYVEQWREDKRKREQVRAMSTACMLCWVCLALGQAPPPGGSWTHL